MKNIAELCKAAYANSAAHGFWDHDEPCFWNPKLTVNQAGREANPCRCDNLDLSMKVSLIHSEISEALEEYRMGDEKRGGPLGAVLYRCYVWKDGQQVERRMIDDVAHPQVGVVFQPCEAATAAADGMASLHKPEGFLVELADAAIRIFDLAGRLDGHVGYGVDLVGGVLSGFATTETLEPGSPMGRWIGELHHVVGDAYGTAVRRPQDVVPIFAALSDAFGLLHELAAKVEGDIDEAIRIKMAYNATRPFKHGKTC